MPKSIFLNAKQLVNLIDSYFNSVKVSSENQLQLIEKPTTKKITENEPVTISGLALFLGFSSREAFDSYEQTGKFAKALKRGRLRVEAEYEKRLITQSASAAIFALKNLGWNDKSENKAVPAKAIKKIKIKILDAGPQLATNEKDVVI